MSETKAIIEKWYKKLNFPKETEPDFYRALEEKEIDGAMTLEKYDKSSDDGEANLLYFLYFCQSLEEKYKEKGIPESILLDTLGDIVVWTKTWSALKGGLYLGELSWLSRHLGMRLFKLGRLQFCMADSEFEIKEKGLFVGAPVVEVHIPEGEPLLRQACESSVDAARDFFEKYFPKFDYPVFTCHSWLLDPTLKEILPKESNILRFADMFTVTKSDPSDALLGYIFFWGAKREDLASCTPKSTLATAVKSAVTHGKTFSESLGYIEK